MSLFIILLIGQALVLSTAVSFAVHGSGGGGLCDSVVVSCGSVIGCTGLFFQELVQ